MLYDLPSKFMVYVITSGCLGWNNNLFLSDELPEKNCNVPYKAHFDSITVMDPQYRCLSGVVKSQ